jgi:hypothetical protein
VLVFKTKDRYEYFARECTSGGRRFDDDCSSCLRVMAPSGTHCSVIDGKKSTKKIRLMDGEYKGMIGWVPGEMIQ